MDTGKSDIISFMMSVSRRFDGEVMVVRLYRVRTSRLLRCPNEEEATEL